MVQKTAAERQEALRKRTKQSVNDRDKKGLGTSTVLDLSKIENLNLYKPKSGRDTNLIDIIPFLITQEWYADLRTPSGRATGLEPGLPDYKLEVPVHKRVGTNNDLSFLCLNRAFGKRCILCEELAAEYDKPESEQSDNVIRALSPSWRCYYNVYDYDEPDKGNQLWVDASTFCFEKNFLDEALDGEEYITFSDLEKGNSVQFKGKEKALGKNTFIEAHSIKFVDRDPYDETIYDEVLSLDAMLIIPTPDEVMKAHLGLDDDLGSIPGQSQDDAPPDAGRTRQRQRPQQKETETPNENVDLPDNQKPGNENQCPNGGRFGEDCNELQECQECPEEIFKACADAKDKGEKKEPEPPERTRTRRNAPKETNQETTSRSRSRRRK